MGEEVIYGGCCIVTGEDGKPLHEYGYICPECMKVFDEDEEQEFEYVVENGKVVPISEII